MSQPGPLPPPPSPPQLPTSMVELILATLPQVISGTTQIARAEDELLFAQVLPVLPHHAAPSVLKAVLVLTNTNPDLTGSPGPFNVDRLLASLTESADSFAGDSPLTWYMTLLAPLAIRRPQTFGRALAWAICAERHVPAMEWMLEQPSTCDLFFDQAELNLCHASQAGRVDILEHLMNHDFPMEYTKAIAKSVGSSGSVNVLDWWYEIRLEIKLYISEVGPPTQFELSLEGDTWTAAFKKGHVQMLEWIYNKYAAEFDDLTGDSRYFWCVITSWIDASHSGHVDILEWARSKFTIPMNWDHGYDELPMDDLHIDVLKWWSENLVEDGDVLPYSHRALEMASAAGRVDVLEWWASSGLPLAFTPAVVQLAMDCGHGDVVQWWHACGEYSQVACGGLSDQEMAHKIPRHPITLASFGRLDWLVEYCEPSETTPMFLLSRVREVSVKFGRIDVLEALEHVFDLIPNLDSPWEGIASIAASSGQLQVLQWWIAQDHLSDVTNPQYLAVMWRQLAYSALEKDQANILEWILASVTARHLVLVVISQAYDIDVGAMLVQRACDRGSVKCLQLLFLLGLVSPTTMTDEQLGQAHPKTREWWAQCVQVANAGDL